ncbi:hypothetical protein FPV67DRAFT_1605748 [Lyophyllum atratum]|nr:hypothetical protein FPV67DRAFT_1605748 [Lyophyllum atratum]
MSSSSIARPDILALLSCLGVKLPKNTKVPDDALNKRLQQALDSTQRYTDVLAPIAPVNPSDLPTWVSSSKPLLEAVSRGNITEAYENMMRGGGARPTSTAREDTFMEVRQVLLSFAHHWDQGHKVFALIDKQGEWCIIVRIVDVFSLGGDPPVPLFSILYREIHRPPTMSLPDHLGQLFMGLPVVQVSSADLERRCLLKLLTMNSKRISPAYKPHREKKEASHRATFLLPVGPLSMLDLGKLNKNPGCEICGTKDTSRCTSCLSCQREHWKEHKGVCRSLKGGTWHTLSISQANSPFSHLPFRTIINRFDTTLSIKSKSKKPLQSDPYAPAPNISIPVIEGARRTSMLLYDRQRSFQVYWQRGEGEGVFGEGERAMGDRMKIYRWARRVGDYHLSVCFDRAPETDPVW